ncbi:hypothetical protein [Nonomuraea mesophila]|uniref:hypothetical protein n=1 Tax=Nonomuraea mesophila TaxID=2530382 RepID=UPI001FE414DE|nr:hypothetical protein [Nonomuraea mesophila]
MDDAAAMYELISAYETAVIGAPDMTPEDVADELVEPGYDRDKDGWLAQDAGGRLLASAWACANGDSDLVDVDVIIRPGAEVLAEELWQAVLGRARELAAERGHDGATLHLGVHRADHVKRAMAGKLGFRPGTSFHRLRIDHDGPVEPPVPPAGSRWAPAHATTSAARRTACTRRPSPSTSGS